jgi:hypothetical protein
MQSLNDLIHTYMQSLNDWMHTYMQSLNDWIHSFRPWRAVDFVPPNQLKQWRTQHTQVTCNVIHDVRHYSWMDEGATCLHPTCL